MFFVPYWLPPVKPPIVPSPLHDPCAVDTGNLLSLQELFVYVVLRNFYPLQQVLKCEFAEIQDVGVALPDAAHQALAG